MLPGPHMSRSVLVLALALIIHLSATGCGSAAAPVPSSQDSSTEGELAKDSGAAAPSLAGSSGSDASAPAPQPPASINLAAAKAFVALEQIPPAEALSVNAALSDYANSISADVGSCDTGICLRATTLLMTDGDDQPRAWWQVEVLPATAPRQPLVLEAVVDLSGSMSGTPLSTVKAALLALVDQMADDDRLGVSVFGSAARRVLSPTLLLGNREILREAISVLEPEASTPTEDGIAFGFAELERLTDSEPVGIRRVLLLTDSLPVLSAPARTTFVSMVEAYSRAGFDLSLFYVGTPLSAQAWTELSNVRGMNLFAPATPEEAVSLVQKDFPLWLQSAAYDVAISAHPSESMASEAAYAPIHARVVQQGGLVTYTSATTFAAPRRGSLLVRLSPASSEALSQDWGALSLSYRDTAGELHALELPVHAPAKGLQAAESSQLSAAQRQVTIAVFFSSLQRSVMAYDADPAAAVAEAKRARQRLLADLEERPDDELAQELVFAAQLIELMKQGAPVGTFSQGN